MTSDQILALVPALLAAAQALPSPKARLAFASDYLRLRTGKPTFEALRGLIDRHFAGETRTRLDGYAVLLTPGDLADALARISADNRKLDDLLVKDFQTQLDARQEDLDINSPEGAAAIPTLALSGLLDTQTAASWGPETVRHLPRGQAIVLPETGHGTLAFSRCARDLGVAFIENPTVALDTSCVAGLTPSFVLPAAAQAGAQATRDSR